VLPLQRLDALALVSARAGPPALVAPGLPNPARQGLRCAADLGRNRGDRRPLRCVLRAVLEHHPNRRLTHLGRELPGCPVLLHGSNLSRSGASDKSGAAQVTRRWAKSALGGTLPTRRVVYAGDMNKTLRRGVLK